MQLAGNTLSERDFTRIGNAVYEHCGINLLHNGKQELVQARLAKLLRTTTYGGNIREYLDHVLGDPESTEFATLIDSLSTNLTSFFREGEHFEHLGRQFLPALLARKRKSEQNRIRGWSAACSTGEEPYSIAMVVLEALAAQEAVCDCRILATDISHRVLQVAREGRYDRARAAPVPPLLRSKYLTSSAQQAGVVAPVAAVRALVHFAHLNLMESWPFAGPLDFIFCRNVMIYFDKATQQRLIQRFWDILDHGGLLFTGHSESLTGIAHKFSYVQPTIYLKS